MFMNIARLMTKSKQKLKDFLADLCNSTTFFLCFCETFLHDGIQDSEIQISNFSIAGSDRYSRVGGGVCAYVRNTVNFKICLCFSNSVYDINRAEQYILTIRVQNGSPSSTRFYGPVHLRRYWSVPVSTGPYILGRPVKFSNSQDADNLHTIRKRMPIPFQ